MSRIIVQKYGGSSLATLEKIEAVADAVAERERGDEGIVLVLSAMGKTTDELTSMARTLSPVPPKRELDMLLSTGEQVSIALMAIALEKRGIDAISFTGTQVGLRTDSLHTQAKIQSIDVSRIEREMDEGRVVIVAGFQGVTEELDVTTLGRGGSDITAMALAVALKAERLEKCTDEDGVYAADPRLVPGVPRIPRISYEEMLEMSFTGARVLHPRAVFFAWKYRVPILVRESLKSDGGTWIDDIGEVGVENPIVSGVTHDSGVAKVTIYHVPDQPGVAARIMETMNERGVHVDMIVQSTTATPVNDISFAVRQEDLNRAVEALEGLSGEMPGIRVQSDERVAQISVVGMGIRSDPTIVARVLRTLADEGINIQMLVTSEVKVSCIVAQDDLRRGVQSLCRKFFMEA